MRKAFLFLSAAVASLCVSCASQVQEPVSASEAASVEVSSAKVPETPYDIVGVPVTMQVLEVHEPCPISVEYPVFGQAKLDAAVQAWAKARLEDAQHYFTEYVKERTEAAEEDPNANSMIMMDGLYFSAGALVVEYSPEKGASILSEERSYLGGAHDGLSYTTLILDANGEEVDPWSEFASAAEGANLFSRECRKQFAEKELFEDMYIPGTEPDPVNFRWLIPKGDKYYVIFEPYAVSTWAEGPQICVVDRKK